MSIQLYTSDLSFSFALVPTIRETYPGVSQAKLAIDPDWNGDASIRIRSRGRHSPGSGNYWCSHIKPANNLSGYIVGSTMYVTSITGLQSGSSTNWTKVSFAHRGVETHQYYYYRAGSSYWTRYTVVNYYFLRISPEGRTYWNVVTRSATQQWHQSPEHMYALALTAEPSSYQTYWAEVHSVSEELRTQGATFEDRHVKDVVDEGIEPNLGCYLNDAYLSAFESLPAITTNNIQNAQAIVDLLKGIVKAAMPGGKLVDGLGSISDAWLGFRYVFNTTKADIQELSSYVERMRAFKQYDMRTVRSYGTTSFESHGITYVVKCSITVRTEDISGIYNAVERFGVALDAYNIWDMIPYSFMVDWFLHIGDLLEKARTRRYAMRLTPVDCWFSISYTFENNAGCIQNDYYRWRSNVDLSQYPATLLRSEPKSGKTWIKRGIDAICILK